MCEPIGGFDPVHVDHEVNVRGTIVVIGGVDGGHFHHAVLISVPATAEPGLAAVERAVLAKAKGGITAVQSGRIG